MELTITKAASFPVALDSKRIMVDNQLVMVYWRQALEVPFGKVQGRKMMTAVEKSISDLATVFPPPRPKASGVCRQQLEEAEQKHGAKSCGVYHFARWANTSLPGIKDPVLWLNNPVLWRELRSGGAHHNAAYLFYHQIAPLIQAVSLLFHTVDPQMHFKYLQQYRYVSSTVNMIY